MSLKIHVNRPSKENTCNLKCRKFTDNLSAKTVRFMIIGGIRICILVDFIAPFLADRPLLAYLQCIFSFAINSDSTDCGSRCEWRKYHSIQKKFFSELSPTAILKIAEFNSTNFFCDRGLIRRMLLPFQRAPACFTLYNCFLLLRDSDLRGSHHHCNELVSQGVNFTWSDVRAKTLLKR